MFFYWCWHIIDPPACLPLGDELCFDFLLGSIIPKEMLEKLSRHKFRPEIILNVLCKYLGYQTLSCLKFFENAEPNEYHNIIAQFLKRGLAKQVFTTNLDLCHEKAINLCERKRIIHLHGICNSSKTILYALDQVSSKSNLAVIESVISTLERKVLLFLGYSGRDNFDIAPALKSLPDSTYFIWTNKRFCILNE